MSSICTVAFTGHRPSKFSFGYDETASQCIAIQNALREQIQILYSQGARRFFTGCAMGTDLWAGEIVLAMMQSGEYPQMELHCCVPYPQQAEKWPRDMQIRHHNLLEHCTTVIYTSDTYSKAAFLIRNCYLVEHCDLLLAVYNKRTAKRSGTGQTVSYAKKMLRRVIYIDPETAKISAQ